MHLTFPQRKNCTTCAHSNNVPVHLCALQSYCLLHCLSMHQDRLFYKLVGTLKKQTADITLLIISFKVHRFSLFYYNALTTFRHVGGRSASLAPISTQLAKDPHLKLSTCTTEGMPVNCWQTSNIKLVHLSRPPTSVYQAD